MHNLSRARRADDLRSGAVSSDFVAKSGEIATLSPQPAFTFSKPIYQLGELNDFFGSRSTVAKLIPELDIVEIGRRRYATADSIAALIERRRRPR